MKAAGFGTFQRQLLPIRQVEVSILRREVRVYVLRSFFGRSYTDEVTDV